MTIDHSVYPDWDDPPDELDSPEDKADYVQRICAAWDFHILPDAETFALFSGWKAIFDAFPLPGSPAYHAFRAWYGWSALDGDVDPLPVTPYYARLDALEDRPADPNELAI